jgi:hypothetical protein
MLEVIGYAANTPKLEENGGLIGIKTRRYNQGRLGLCKFALGAQGPAIGVSECLDFSSKEIGEGNEPTQKRTWGMCIRDRKMPCRRTTAREERSTICEHSTPTQHIPSLFEHLFRHFRPRGLKKKKVCTAHLLNQVTPVSPSCGFERARRVFIGSLTQAVLCVVSSCWYFVFGLFVLVLCGILPENFLR